MKIISTENIGINELKILVFGESGAGKTSLAKTIKEPTIILSAEAGLLPLRGEKIDVIDLTKDDSGKLLPKEKRIDRLIESYKYLQTEEAQKKYKWVFIDSLTEINQNLLEKLQAEYTERKDSLVLFGELSKGMRGIVKSFRDLPSYNVVFTALSEIEKDENSQRYTTISLVGKFASQLPAFFDAVLFLHAARDEEGNIKRVLVTEKSEKLVAKDRSAALSKFESPDLSIIANKIRNKKTETKKEGK